MPIIPLYTIGPSGLQEPYVAYDLLVDYPEIDIEPLPGVPRVGGVVRSYEYALYFHSITDDVEREKARRPINIKKKSEFISKIKRSQRITSADHLSVKNSFYLAGNTDLWLAPDVGEPAPSSGGYSASGVSDFYFIYGESSSTLWNSNSTTNSLLYTFGLLTIYENNTHNNYLRVSSAVYSIPSAYSLSSINNITGIYNLIQNFLDNNQITISGGNLSAPVVISVTDTSLFYNYYFDNNVFPHPQTQLPYSINDMVLIANTDNPNYKLLFNFDINTNTVHISLYQFIDLDITADINNLSLTLVSDIFDAVASELYNIINNYLDLRFTYQSSVINASNFIAFITYLDSNIFGSYDRLFFIHVVPDNKNIKNNYRLHQLNTSNSGIRNVMNTASSGAQVFSDYHLNNIIFDVGGTGGNITNIYFQLVSSGYLFQLLTNITSLSILFENDNYDSVISAPISSSLLSINYFFDINQNIVNIIGGYNWLYYSDLNSTISNYDYLFYPLFNRMGVNNVSNPSNVLRYAFDFITDVLGSFIRSALIAPYHVGGLVYTQPATTIVFTPDTFQLALESLDNVDLLLDNGFTSTRQDYNTYAYRIAEHALDMTGEKIPALAVINTPINTPATFTHGLPANVAINTFVTTSYFKFEGLGFPVLLPFSTLYAIRVTALHTNLNEFAPIFNKPLISVVPVDKVYTNLEREMLLNNKINSPKIYRGSWAFNNNLTATFENIIFKEENIRRLANAMAREMKLHLKPFIGQVNNRYTREKVINKLKEVFSKVIDIHKYRPESYIIICDETNNQDYSNFLYVDVAVKMPLSVKYVVIVTIAQPI